MADMLPLCRSSDDYGRIVFTLFWGGGAPRREASKNAPAMQKLPPIWLSGYPAIIFGKESEQAQEKRNEKSEADLPKKVYPAIRLFEYNPRLRNRH